MRASQGRRFGHKSIAETRREMVEPGSTSVSAAGAGLPTRARARRSTPDLPSPGRPLPERGGAAHHQFVAGDGEILIIDEGDDADHFGTSSTVSPRSPTSWPAPVWGPPEVSIYEILETPDRF
jgi:hypothetical protein